MKFAHVSRLARGLEDRPDYIGITDHDSPAPWGLCWHRQTQLHGETYETNWGSDAMLLIPDVTTCYKRDLKRAAPQCQKTMVATRTPASTPNKHRATSLIYIYRAPALVMVGFIVYLIAPLWLPVASRAFTTRIDSLSATSPKTTWRPSSHEVATVVMKNWEPLLWS